MMMLSQAARALGAEIQGTDVMFNAVSKDTRSIHQGDLYVAIKGERFDGHEFVEQAVAAGAVAAMVSDCRVDDMNRGVNKICVDDTRLALGSLATYWAGEWRQQQVDTTVFPSLVVQEKKLVGITGSNGKTTVKEMCGSIFSHAAGKEAVLMTRGNLNNDIGLPLTLLGLREKHQLAVVEMGANHVGEIDYLSSLARPDVAVLTNAGSAHLEGFGSIENIASAKAEIFNGLSDAGIAVINLDDRFSQQWLDVCRHRSKILFSMQNSSADCFATRLNDGCYLIRTEQGSFELKLSAPGMHNVMNALAATAVACAISIGLDAVENGLNTFQNINGRLRTYRLQTGAMLIDDSYNANPSSVRAAIDVLVQKAMDSGVRKILVLGDMGELGEDSGKLHSETGHYARQSGVDFLYATGENSKSTVEGFGEGAQHFDTQADLLTGLMEIMTGDEVVLVKGSRSAAMENIVNPVLNDIGEGKLGDEKSTRRRNN